MRWKSWLLNRNALLVAAAVAMAGCAFLLARRYLQGQAAATRQQLVGRAPCSEFVRERENLAVLLHLIGAEQLRAKRKLFLTWRM